MKFSQKTFASLTIIVGLFALAAISFAQPFVPTNTYTGPVTFASGTTNFTLVVPQIATVVSVRARINISYRPTSDLTITLFNPMGTPVVLSQNNGVGSDFVNTVFQDGQPSITTGSNPYTGFFAAQVSLLANYIGSPTNGNWILRISNIGAFTGTVVGYELELNNSTLPVEMTSFSAISGDNRVALSWRTESETDNARFVLYRSLNRDEQGDVVAQVSGHGTTATSHTYSYVDTHVQNGSSYYYRISDVDFNGIERLHPMIVQATPSASGASTGIPLQYSLDQNYPNPFNPTTEISYSIPTAGNVRLTVFDVTGKSISTLVDNYQTANTYRVKFDATKLSSGIYFYTLTTGNYSSTKRMVLMK